MKTIAKELARTSETTQVAVAWVSMWSACALLLLLK